MWVYIPRYIYNRHQKYIRHITDECSSSHWNFITKWIMLRKVLVYLLVVAVIEKTKPQKGSLSQSSTFNVNSWTIVNLFKYIRTLNIKIYNKYRV